MTFGWLWSTYFRCLQGPQESWTLSLRRFGGGRGRGGLSAMVTEWRDDNLHPGSGDGIGTEDGMKDAGWRMEKWR